MLSRSKQTTELKENSDVLLPTSNPQIPTEIYESKICKDIMIKLTKLLENSQWFDS